MIDKNYYDQDYYNGAIKSNYLSYNWTPQILEHCLEIIKKYRPKRVLDVGCAKGFYVQEFRDLGVDAYGVDISEWAISQAPSEIKKYVFNASATKIPFPDKFFDLVISADVLEHIPIEEIDQACLEILRVGERQDHFICLERLPWDKDESHVTIKPMEWWVQKLPGANLAGVVYQEREENG